MALSTKARARLTAAMAHKVYAKEVADVIDSHTSTLAGLGLSTIPCGDVAAIATANAATQTASYVQADVQSIATLANQTKTTVNAILSALKTAGMMS